jgi:transcriptional regulator with XRE-family HTH domain
VANPKKGSEEEEQTMSDRLRTAIRGSGISLNDLGRKTGVDSGRLSRFMRGQRDLTLGAAEQLCKVLGLQLVAFPPPAEATGQAEKPAKGKKSPKENPSPKKGK